MKIIAGIDVGKGSLDVSISGGTAKSFENNKAGFEALLKDLRSGQVSEAVCEATGGYERALVAFLRKHKLSVQVAHPNRVRAFAQACGYQAKTDKLDAQVLARYGEVFEAGEAPEHDEDIEVLKELLRRRQQLIEQRTQELNRLEKMLKGRVKRSCERHIAWMDKEIAALEKAYQAHLQAKSSLAEKAALYQSVRGIGVLTSATLIAELPELGQRSASALTSLAGLAPWASDSGRQHGYRMIRGGRSIVRRALYMSSLSAVRYEGEMRRFYLRLRERGKPAKLALVAVMRKLLLLLNAIAKRGTPWLETYEKNS